MKIKFKNSIIVRFEHERIISIKECVFTAQLNVYFSIFAFTVSCHGVFSVRLFSIPLCISLLQIPCAMDFAQSFVLIETIFFSFFHFFFLDRPTQKKEKIQSFLIDRIRTELKYKSGMSFKRIVLFTFNYQALNGSNGGGKIFVFKLHNLNRLIQQWIFPESLI